MARLSKNSLRSIVISKIRSADCLIIEENSVSEHPFEFVVERGGEKLPLLVYIWNTTHGGNTRSLDEFRIQITSGVSKFEVKAGRQTLILGWNDEYNSFAAFDVKFHRDTLGSSPSIQINESTIARAAENGVAQQLKSSSEIAVAVRGDMLVDYVFQHEKLHSSMLDAYDLSDLTSDRKSTVRTAPVNVDAELANPSPYKTFRLMHAETAPIHVRTMLDEGSKWFHPKIRLQHNTLDELDDRDNTLTAVIGRNGTGKSHLLSSIVEAFRAIELVVQGKRQRIRNLSLESFVYQLGGDVYKLSETEDGQHFATLNDKPIDIADLSLPRRIVALTITPFDKFAVPPMSDRNGDGYASSVYRYLGLRDRTNKASIENLLFRAIYALFERTVSPNRKRADISRVFDFLELLPRLSVIYRTRISRSLVEALQEGKGILSEGVIRNKAISRRTLEILKSGEVSEELLTEWLIDVSNNENGGFIKSTTNFGPVDKHDDMLPALQSLRKCGFLQLRSVEVERRDGSVTDLKRTSSGQLGMVTALLSLAAEIEDGSLVLVDEPEVSLHPEWQVKYIELLLGTFNVFEGCHFIIATHSPLVVSELPANATLVALDNPAPPSATSLSGRSADVLLAEAFHTVSNGNLHIRDLLLKALRDAADGNASTTGFQDEVRHLDTLTKALPSHDGVRIVVEGLNKVAAFAVQER